MNTFQLQIIRMLKSIAILALFLLPVSKLYGQYEKNPLLPIVNDGYNMVVEKFVRIPDDNGIRPRINCLTFIGNRIFVTTETGGKVYEILDNGDGTYNAELFFDVKAAILSNTGRELSATGNWHSGLRSIAFHPDFLENGKFYTSVMEERPADTSGHHYLSDVDEPIEADGTLIEWTYDFGEDQVYENSYREVFRVGVPAYDHPMKQISFNRWVQPGDEDYGLLYISHGDGNPYYAPDNGGQNNDARGKILRINPLATDTTPYTVPESNPFVNDTNWIDEIYATGMRNPHTLCFAKDANDSVYLISGNAGRDNIEEINIVKKGENYGWAEREGTYVQLPGGGLNTGIEALPDNEADFGYTFPAAQWSRSDPALSGFTAYSIAGGFVYSVKETGERIFLSGDFPQSGFVMYNILYDLTAAITKLDPESPDIDEPEELTQAEFKLLNIYFDQDNDTSTSPIAKTSMLDIINDESSWDGSGRSDLRFGQDQNENIYISSKRNGWVYKIQSITPPLAPPDVIALHKLSEGDFASVYPNPLTVSGRMIVAFNTPLEQSAKVRFVGADGSIIWASDIPAGLTQYTLDLAVHNLQPGYYLIKINSGNNSEVKPVALY